MIEGTVDAALRAVVRLSLRGPSGRTGHVDAVVDTGFNLYLTLPPTLVSELGLPRTGVAGVVLADGSEAGLDVHDVTVLWDGEPRDVQAYATEGTPLAGMALLERHDLRVEVEEGGRVVIEARR